jgi:hypothetical protein
MGAVTRHVAQGRIQVTTYTYKPTPIIVINDHAGDMVTLLGVAASSLTANNFSFKA